MEIGPLDRVNVATVAAAPLAISLVAGRLLGRNYLKWGALASAATLAHFWRRCRTPAPPSASGSSGTPAPVSISEAYSRGDLDKVRELLSLDANLNHYDFVDHLSDDELRSVMRCTHDLRPPEDIHSYHPNVIKAWPFLVPHLAQRAPTICGREMDIYELFCEAPRILGCKRMPLDSLVLTSDDLEGPYRSLGGSQVGREIELICSSRVDGREGGLQQYLQRPGVLDGVLEYLDRAVPPPTPHRATRIRTILTFVPKGAPREQFVTKLSERYSPDWLASVFSEERDRECLARACTRYDQLLRLEMAECPSSDPPQVRMERLRLAARKAPVIPQDSASVWLTIEQNFPDLLDAQALVVLAAMRPEMGADLARDLRYRRRFIHSVWDQSSKGRNLLLATLPVEALQRLPDPAPQFATLLEQPEPPPVEIWGKYGSADFRLADQFPTFAVQVLHCGGDYGALRLLEHGIGQVSVEQVADAVVKQPELLFHVHRLRSSSRVPRGLEVVSKMPPPRQYEVLIEGIRNDRNDWPFRKFCAAALFRGRLAQVRLKRLATEPPIRLAAISRVVALCLCFRNGVLQLPLKVDETASLWLRDLRQKPPPAQYKKICDSLHPADPHREGQFVAALYLFDRPVELKWLQQLAEDALHRHNVLKTVATLLED